MRNRIWLVIMLYASVAFAQPPKYNDWDLDSLQYNPDEFTSDFDMDVSAGWFPRLYSDNIFLWNVYYNPGNIWPDVQIKGHHELGNAVNEWHAPYDLSVEERQINEKYSKDNENSLVVGDLNELGVAVLFPFLNSVYLNANAAFYWQTDVLADIYETNQFRTVDNQVKKFKEANIIELYEHGLTCSFNVNVPIYGSSMYMGTHFASFYYLTAGVAGRYAIHSEILQYLLIATEKDKISYANGWDTLHIKEGWSLKSVERLKYNINLGVGMNLIVNTVNVGFEVLYSFPVNDVLKDAYWRQHTFKFSIFLGI